MRAIIIGAGRGSRLMPLTEDMPKCLAPIGDRRILDHMIDALKSGGMDEIVFVGGYEIQKVKDAHPELNFILNSDWEHNNILASLFHADQEMDGGFICSYADILYRPSAIKALMEGSHDITLVIDTDWRTRYAKRSKHPEDDAEKVVVDGEEIIGIGRGIKSEAAHGEYIGVARFTAAGSQILRENYRRCLIQYDGKPFHSSASFKKAYLIDLFKELLLKGVSIHKVDIHGNYFEVDTTEDYTNAVKEWC